MSEINPAIKIAVLEEKFGGHTRAIEKIDSAIEKIAETNQQILKMLALHDEKILSGEKNDVLISKEIEEVREHCNKSHQQITDKYLSIEEKVNELTKIKWMTVGMATLLSILVGVMAQLASGIIKNSDIINLPHSQNEIHQ